MILKELEVMSLRITSQTVICLQDKTSTGIVVSNEEVTGSPKQRTQVRN